MKLHEKIRFIRQLKGWSQEDVKLSRLEQIAQVFGMELLELFGLNEKNVFNLIGNHTQFHHSLINSSSIEPTDFKHELEKANHY